LNNWIEISAERLTANYHALQAAAGDATEVLAVVKANAYGHGAGTCSAILAGAGARWLGVTCAEEGVRVRALSNVAKTAVDVLVMSGFLAPDVPLMMEHSLVPVLWTQEHVRWLQAARGTRVHVEIDTAMSRQGVLPGAELAALLDAMAAAGLVLDGIFTHFASSEEAPSPLTQAQQRRFEQAVAQVREAGLRPAWVHAGNSSTVDNPAQPTPWLAALAATVGARAMVRPGIALYGYCLPIDGAASPQVRPHLEQVMTWKARVLSVRDLVAGESVGYNGRYTATAPMRVALLPVGYADGLRRELSSTNEKPGGWVMIAGRRAAILGRISMNLTVVDVTAISGVQAGDEAVLLGDGVTADDHARLAGTIAYEILCGIHPCG
jgi:alanine racemase